MVSFFQDHINAEWVGIHRDILMLHLLHPMDWSLKVSWSRLEKKKGKRPNFTYVITYPTYLKKIAEVKNEVYVFQVANDIPNLEAVRYSLKTPFDRNIVTQFELEEIIMDYGFHHLGIEDSAISYPVVMTEAFANPQSSRISMNELLFEGYQAPKVTYGIDSLFSYYKSQPDFAHTKKTAMIISLGFHSVHFLPIINGQLDSDNGRRLNVGGFHLTNFLHRHLQLKYSAHANNISIGM